MITDFHLFGLTHILSIVIPILIGVIFILFANKYPHKRKRISILLASTIVLIRSVRYVFDIYLGVFQIQDLLSLHVCHIDLILLVICLLKPNKQIFTFIFLVGIPAALSVAFMPGKIHPAPGLLRAVFFIMSHTMLCMGAIYLLIVYQFKITKKHLIFYYIFSFIGLIVIYLFNILTHSNFMYLIAAPSGTVLEVLYSTFGPFFYIVSIYVLLVMLLTLLYFLYIFILHFTKNKQ